MAWRDAQSAVGYRPPGHETNASGVSRAGPGPASGRTTRRSRWFSVGHADSRANRADAAPGAGGEPNQGTRYRI